jgi:DNA polymerase
MAMRWSERQRAMLQVMGVRLFGPALPPAFAPGPVRPEPVEGPSNPQGERTQAPIPQAEAARPEIATLDWPALREAVASCRACALCESRQQTVFGVGNPRAHWLIVGEAPGEQEDRQGEPFVGPAGQLLDNMLRALGLTREDAAPEHQVFIANTLKCRPPKNRNPDPAETALCAPFLARQIALVQPRIILAMGRFAAHALLASEEPLGKLRGRVHQYRGVPLVVTYHPAYLLRTLADKARAWEDLCLAASVAEGH